MGGNGGFICCGIDRIPCWSEVVGEAADWVPKPPGVETVGEATWEGGVGLVFGEVADCMPCIAAAPGSSFGAMLEADLRA
jgi:hypothetical protein